MQKGVGIGRWKEAIPLLEEPRDSASIALALRDRPVAGGEFLQVTSLVGDLPSEVPFLDGAPGARLWQNN